MKKNIFVIFIKNIIKLIDKTGSSYNSKILITEDENEYDVEWVSPKIESREVLYERINLRVDKMLELGLIEETKSLLGVMYRNYWCPEDKIQEFEDKFTEQRMSSINFVSDEEKNEIEKQELEKDIWKNIKRTLKLQLMNVV